jgi:hypothetical protein
MVVPSECFDRHHPVHDKQSVACKWLLDGSYHELATGTSNALHSLLHDLVAIVGSPVSEALDDMTIPRITPNNSYCTCILDHQQVPPRHASLRRQNIQMFTPTRFLNTPSSTM